MSEHCVSLHLIEPGSRGGDALFEIAMVLTDDEMESLSQFDADTWRSTICRAQRRIRDHVHHRSSSEETARVDNPGRSDPGHAADAG
jgi:hypothetical protein